MTVKFDVNREDYWKYNRHAIFHTKQIRNSYIKAYGLAAIVIIFIFYEFRKTTDMPATSFILLCISATVISLIFSYILSKKRIMKVPSTSGGTICEHIIDINKTGISEKTKVNESHYEWNGILRIEQNKKYIYIFVDNNLGHIIPKRAFVSDNEANIFYHEANEYWHNSKN